MHYAHVVVGKNTNTVAGKASLKKMRLTAICEMHFQ
jgi:hypothetical protein